MAIRTRARPGPAAVTESTSIPGPKSAVVGDEKEVSTPATSTARV
ncbi:MAG: hypothetical protein U0835_24705 [Isosphaeraceae bacterium]